MSEQTKMSAGLVSETASPTAGMLLRSAREASGLHVAALAVAIKVPVKKLEALEADRFDDLPDAVFVRALAGSVCRALKIDPAPILSKLPHSAMPRLDRDERGINTPFDTSRMQYGNSLLSFVSRPAALWVIGLLVAALVVLYFPEVQFVSQAVVAPVSNVEIAGPGNTVGASTAGAIPATSGVEVAVVPASAPGVAAPSPASSASDGQALAVTPVALPAQSLSPSPIADLLVFKAKSTAWVRVNDANGTVVFEKTLAAGESAPASGVPPLAIVVGNVAATELLVRGQAFNLEEVAKNNVARFEVK